MKFSNVRSTGEMKAVATEVMSTTTPGQVLLAIITFPFLVIGWIIGKLWYVGVYCFVAAMVGYWNGAGVPPEARGAKQPPSVQ